VRGGLDDALHKLARRDELRRRTSGESPSTPPAVTELVEAIAGVISRHPELGVTVGVEGAGDPVLLHFGFADGVVQVSADNTVAARATEAAGTTRADFEIEVEAEPVYDTATAYDATPAYETEPPRASRDDQDRFGPTDFDYEEPPTAERPFVSPSYADHYARRPGESTGDLADRMRPADGYAEPAPHPFAATPPPPVPPQNLSGYVSAQGYGEPTSGAPLHTHAESPAPQRIPQQATPMPAGPPPTVPSHVVPPQAMPHQTVPVQAVPVQAVPVQAVPVQAAPQQAPSPAAEPGFPPPLAQPIPLQVERPEETEQAARRLAALLRDDPTLLDAPHD
jgi:hypothetical protein